LKKWMLILVAVVFVASGLITGCGCEKAGVTGKSAQLGRLKITVNDAHFHEEYSSEIGMKIWEGFIVELTLKNVGKESEYLLFELYSRFYIQDTEGRVYKNLKAYTGWEDRDDYRMLTPLTGLHHLELEPGETRDLILKFVDIPEDATGLKLFCKESAVEEGKRISIPLEVRVEESKPVSEPIDFESWAEAAIAWAESNLESDHWYELCLRFVANAFMQQGDPPAEVPEGTWTSAWDAVNGDEDFDLVLQDSDNWHNAPRGALIFFDQTDDNSDGHVGIYLGDGRIIHAYGVVKTNTISESEDLPRVGHYIGWAYPPERWRPVSEPTSVPDIVGEIQNGKTFTKPPTSPRTPEEIAAAFYFLINEEEYSEAKKLLNPDALLAEEEHFPLSAVREYFSVHPLQSIKVEKVEIIDKNFIDVYFKAWFKELSTSRLSMSSHAVYVYPKDGRRCVITDSELLALLKTPKRETSRFSRSHTVSHGEGWSLEKVEIISQEWVEKVAQVGLIVCCTDEEIPCELSLLNEGGKWKIDVYY